MPPGSVAAQNPFNVLLTKEANIHNPFLRGLAKIATHVGKGLEAMSPQYPAIEEARTRAALEPAQEAEIQARTQDVQSQQSEREAAAGKKAAPGFKPLGGEESIARDPNGNPLGVIGINDNGQPEMRTFAAGPAPQPQGGAAAPTAGQQIPAAGPQFSIGKTKATTPEQTAVPAEQVKSFPKDIKESFPSLTPGQVKSLGAQLGPNPTQADMAKVQAEAERYDQANQRAADTATNRDLAKTSRQQAADEKKKAKEDVVGWAFDPKTKEKILTNQAEADEKGYTQFQKTTPADVEKDEGALRQMNDVQLNLSRYRQAVNALPNSGIPAEKVNKINAILSDKDLNIRIGEGGILPGVFTDIVQQSGVGRVWNQLSVPEQNVVSGYLRAKAAVVAYQKALTGVGRANKETLDLEMNNLPAPTVGATVANPRLDAFQENIDTASQGFGRIPWLETPKDVKGRVEQASPKGAGSKAAPTVGAVEQGYRFKGGNPADAKNWEKQ